MCLDLAKSYDWIMEGFAARRTVAESMSTLIDRCAATRPHQDWSKLRDLPYNNLSALATWLEQPFRFEPPRTKLEGLWFGMFNPYYDDEPVADLYVCGSNRFDLDPMNFAWATGPLWWPEHRYAHSEIMAAIYRIAYQEHGLGNDAEYSLCLGYGAFAIRDLLNALDPSLILDCAGPVGVAVAFDSGDGILLGRMGAAGLEPLAANSS
jgi:hypothetical protein